MLKTTMSKDVHFLNPVASAIFLPSDGALDPRSIATILLEEFSLADVWNCLTNHEANSLMGKIG